MTVLKSIVQNFDRLASKTRHKEEEGKDDTNNNEMNEEDSIQDIAFFCNEDKEDEEDIDSDIEESDWNYSHTSLINQSNANSNRLVEARQSSNSSLIFEPSTETSTNNALTGNSDGRPSQNKNTRIDQLLWNFLDGFKTIIKLASESLLGGESLADVYTDIDGTIDHENKDTFRNIIIESKNSKPNTKCEAKIPTLSGVARMIAREEGKRLDEKQYIMYEVLACTFLLDLINKKDVNGRSALARK